MFESHETTRGRTTRVAAAPIRSVTSMLLASVASSLRVAAITRRAPAFQQRQRGQSRAARCRLPSWLVRCRFLTPHAAAGGQDARRLRRQPCEVRSACPRGTCFRLAQGSRAGARPRCSHTRCAQQGPAARARRRASRAGAEDGFGHLDQSWPVCHILDRFRDGTPTSVPRRRQKRCRFSGVPRTEEVLHEARGDGPSRSLSV